METTCPHAAGALPVQISVSHVCTRNASQWDCFFLTSSAENSSPGRWEFRVWHFSCLPTDSDYWIYQAPSLMPGCSLPFHPPTLSLLRDFRHISTDKENVVLIKRGFSSFRSHLVLIMDFSITHCANNGLFCLKNAYCGDHLEKKQHCTFFILNVSGCAWNTKLCTRGELSGWLPDKSERLFVWSPHEGQSYEKHQVETLRRPFP